MTLQVFRYLPLIREGKGDEKQSKKGALNCGEAVSLFKLQAQKGFTVDKREL